MILCSITTPQSSQKGLIMELENNPVGSRDVILNQDLLEAHIYDPMRKSKRLALCGAPESSLFIITGVLVNIGHVITRLKSQKEESGNSKRIDEFPKQMKIELRKTTSPRDDPRWKASAPHKTENAHEDLEPSKDFIPYLESVTDSELSYSIRMTGNILRGVIQDWNVLASICEDFSTSLKCQIQEERRISAKISAKVLTSKSSSQEIFPSKSQGAAKARSGTHVSSPSVSRSNVSEPVSGHSRRGLSGNSSVDSISDVDVESVDSSNQIPHQRFRTSDFAGEGHFSEGAYDTGSRGRLIGNRGCRKQGSVRTPAKSKSAHRPFSTDEHDGDVSSRCHSTSGSVSMGFPNPKSNSVLRNQDGTQISRHTTRLSVQDRSYDKPWLQPLPDCAASSISSLAVNTSSEFIKSLVPGHPDLDLIECLERDCLLTLNPNFKSDKYSEDVATNISGLVSFDQIAGLKGARAILEEAAILPLILPEFFTGIRRPWKGVLLYGPPGTGKTLLAKAVACECSSTFFSVSVASLTAKYRGDSEKLVRYLFAMARFYSPTVIFFDEIDALVGSRGANEHEASRRTKSELLVQMDGLYNSLVSSPESVNNNSSGSFNSNSNCPRKDALSPEVASSVEETKSSVPCEPVKKKTVLVIAATNHPWDIDEALRRRLEKRIYIPLPDEESRTSLFEIKCTGLRIDPEVQFTELSKMTEGYSGADIECLSREASMMGLRKKIREKRNDSKTPLRDHLITIKDEVDLPVKKADFMEALKNVQRSVGKDDLDKFELWSKEFGSI